MATERAIGFRNNAAANAQLASMAAAVLLVGVMVGGFATVFDQTRHWSLIPLFLCGVLTGTDALDWFRGRRDTYDPVGLLGVYGLYFFFLAPLLHITWNYWIGGVAPPPDWRDWIGHMAWLNVLGLSAYRVCRQCNVGGAKLRNLAPWRLRPNRAFVVLPIALCITACLQGWVYLRFGGISGYVQTYVERQPGFAGMGWVFMICESFPALAMVAFVFYRRTRSTPVLALCVALVRFFSLQMVFGGLRGSRSNTVFALFWAVGMIHFGIRPVPKAFIVVD